MSGKKRKKASAPNADGNKGNEGGEDDDGYKTDEEQWGGNRRNGENNQGSKQPVVATHKGALKVGQSSKKSAEGPPLKQARFSVDTTQKPPEAVQSADASAQQLSSLSGSDSAGIPAVTASSAGQTSGLTTSSAAATGTSSNPSSSSGPKPGRPPSSGNAGKGGKAGVSNDPNRRAERNAREKERSGRIAKQIDDLRTLLSRGGVVVSKGTKSSVLTEAANYIHLLQQQQAQWDMDRQALMAQMTQIGLAPGGPTNPQALQQQLQALSGVQPLVGGLPGQPTQTQLPPQGTNFNAITPNDYKFIFDNSSVGMAIASLGGAFIDCNSIFCLLSDYTREEVTSMTIFNMTDRRDLQHAFDLISQMITPTLDNSSGMMSDPFGSDKSSVVLRGAMKKPTDLGLSISLIKGEHGIAKCFCITLVRILSMETTRPDTVSIEVELPQVWSTKQQKNVGFGASPAYTSG